MITDLRPQPKVLFVLFGGDVMGGSERLVYTLAVELARLGLRPVLACFGEKAFKEYYDLGCPVYILQKRNRFDVAAIRRLAHLIRDEKIDVVNAHHFMPFLYSFLASKVLTQTPLVYTEHSIWEIERLSAFWRSIGRYLFRRIDAVVGVSPVITNRLQQMFGLNDGVATTIPNGVELNVSATGKYILSRRDLGVADSDILIAMVANFKAIKNHLFLLRSFYEVSQQISQPVKLVLIGGHFPGLPEDTYPEVQRFIQSHGLAEKVILLGYRSDVPQLLALVDVFCLTSFREGLPISVLEAMSAALPVVGADVDGIREVVIPGENGVLVPSDDVAKLTSALMTLINNKKLRLAFGAKSKQMASRYSREECVQRYFSLFRSRAKVPT